MELSRKHGASFAKGRRTLNKTVYDVRANCDRVSMAWKEVGGVGPHPINVFTVPKSETRTPLCPLWYGPQNNSTNNENKKN